MTTADVSRDDQTGHGHETPSYDDINTPVIVLVGVISSIVTLLSIMFVQGLCYHWQNSYLKIQSTEAVSMPANQEIQQQKAILEGGDEVVSIENAMQQVIAKYGN